MRRKTIAKRSTVYGHFTGDDRAGYKCKHCGNTFVYKNTTSNLCKHILEKHKISLDVKDESLTKFMTGTLTVGCAVDYLVDFVAVDLLPFSIVEGDGFKRMITRMNPNFPKGAFNRHDVSHRAALLLETKMESWKLHLKAGTNAPCLTLDLWSGKNAVSVIGITAHWISKDWEMKRIALDVQEIFGSHTAENIVAAVRKTLTAWEINSVFATVRDRGANVVLATHQLGTVTEWDLDCFAHVLNTTVTNSIDTVPKVKSTLDLVRRVVKHFRKSYKSWNLLVEDFVARDAKSKKPHRPVLDSKTRWFSTFKMLEWFLEVNDSLDAILPKIDVLKDIEISQKKKMYLWIFMLCYDHWQMQQSWLKLTHFQLWHGLLNFIFYWENTQRILMQFQILVKFCAQLYKMLL